MAKSRKLTTPEVVLRLLINKTAWVRKVLKPVAARANRWGATVLAIAFAIGVLANFLWPKDEIRQLRERLVNNTDDFEAHLQLAEKFLENNQLEEAQRALQIAENQLRGGGAPPLAERRLGGESVLGEASSQRLEDLWRKKHLSDPEDIKRLIAGWEKMIEEKPDYRDGYLQLAILYLKLGETEKAKENLRQALELDPNSEPARELEKILGY